MFGKKRQEIDPRVVQELAEDVRMTMRKVRDLQEAYDVLDDKYTRMRGLIYAKKMHRAPEGEANGETDLVTPPKPVSREELRRQLVTSGRFMPGKPPVHIEK